MKQTFNGFVQLRLYSGFIVLDAPKLGLMGLRYSVGGFAGSRARAIYDLQLMVDRRNELAPDEKMRVDVGSIKFDVTEECIQYHKTEALKKLPSGVSAMEVCNGDPGRLFNQSLASLIDHSQRIEDINSILT